LGIHSIDSYQQSKDWVEEKILHDKQNNEEISMFEEKIIQILDYSRVIKRKKKPFLE
jgi:hypothetical protein